MNLNPVRVVIADDHRLFAEALKLMLDREESIEVVGIAGDGHEAIDLALIHLAEVVLMDVRMPVMDGVEASRRLRAIRPETHVIFVTSFFEDELDVDLADVGATAFLSKTGIHETVVAAIHAANVVY